MRRKKLRSLLILGKIVNRLVFTFRYSSKKRAFGAFKKLRCVRYEPQNTDGEFGWRWFYDQEAKKLKFKYSMSKIPKEARPVVLGDFFFPNEEVMYLDVRYE